MKIFESIAYFLAIICLAKCQFGPGVQIYRREDFDTQRTPYGVQQNQQNQQSIINQQTFKDFQQKYQTTTQNSVYVNTQPNNYRPVPAPHSEDLISKAIFNMTLNMLKKSKLLTEVSNMDYFTLAPITIIGALALALLGSIGQTHSELARFLELSSIPNIETDPLSVHEHIRNLLKKLETGTGLDDKVIHYAVSIFHQNQFSIRPEFKDVAQRFYGAELQAVDFERQPMKTQQHINNWVSKSTQGKIPKLFSNPLASYTNAIITSVMYFKADWEHPFMEGYTKPRPFHSNGRNNPSDRLVEMMTNAGEFPYFRDNGNNLEIMGFPYKGNRITFYVIIADESSKQNISVIESALSEKYINYLIGNTAPVDSVVLLPKMKLETSISLRPILEKAGVFSLFYQYQSNLALMSSGYSTSYSGHETPGRPVPSADQSIVSFGNVQLGTTCNQTLNISRCFQQPIRNPRTNNNNDNQLHKNSDSLQKLKVIRQQLETSQVNPGLYADDIIHKVYVDINEKGTEAAAATGFILNRSGSRLLFRVDVPFIYFIHDRLTKTVLLWGSVKSPPAVSA